MRVDERVSRALIHPDRFSELLADLGNVQVAVPVLAAVLLHVAWRARRIGRDRWWLPATAAAVLMALVPALVVPLKELTDRPGTPVMPPATGYFPSGHTATATVAYGSATLLLLPWLRTAYARRELLIACLVVNAAVGFGLIRRGYHWPLDVVASWCLGGMLLSSLWLLLSRSNHRTPTATPDGRTEPARPTTPSSHAGTPPRERYRWSRSALEPGVRSWTSRRVRSSRGAWITGSEVRVGRTGGRRQCGGAGPGQAAAVREWAIRKGLQGWWGNRRVELPGVRCRPTPSSKVSAG